ncbi:MAG: serine hydrolase [Planctomycetes bacterium]|nr:serine hydrolase [Planctomycetota bacterium]MCC7168883.1 serine hydrolase [Planctomycetota bacterium]
MLALALLVTAAPLFADPPVSRTALDDARARWTEAMELVHVPGMAVVGVKDGAVAFVECLGERRVRDASPVDADTRFYIASVTKTFIATTAKILEEERKLALNDPVAKWLPKFSLTGHDVAKSPTIEDLLAHRPGLESTPIVFRDAYTGQIDDDVYFRLLGDVEPTGVTTYSNVHFTLAGRVLEVVDGARWQDVVAKRVFEPLGMTRSTGYASVLWGDDDSAEPHVGIATGAIAVPHKSDRTMHAAGGLGTTPNDAARWLSFQLGDGRVNGKVVLSPEGLADLRTRRSTVERDTILPWFSIDGFALGWQTCTYRDRPAFGHGGGYTGATSFFLFVPENRVGVAVLLNRDSTSCMALALTDAMDLLLGLEPGPMLMERVRDTARNADWPDVSGPSTNPALHDGALSLAADRYVGHYTDETWGDVEVTLENGALRVRLGDFDCELHTTGVDTFEARIGTVRRFPGQFYVDDGVVEDIGLAAQSEREILFERVE